MEIDKLGKDGEEPVDGMVTQVGKAGKTVTLKTADGTEQAREVAGHDTEGAAKGIGESASKTGKITVHSTEDAGKRVVHLFKKI